MRINKPEQGFTLIELVVVIVILGILAATAIPKFVDLSSEAGTAAANGVAGAIASATSVNYAAKMAGKTTAATLNGDNAATCTKTVLQPFVSGITLVDTADTDPADGNTYEVSGGSGTPASCASNPGGATTCTIKGFKGNAVQATVICTGA